MPCFFINISCLPPGLPGLPGGSFGIGLPSIPIAAGCNPPANFSLPPITAGLATQLPDLNIVLPPIPIPALPDIFYSLDFLNLKATLNADFMKDILAAIASLLEQIGPFLMMYQFILVILEMILCIIEVLCAIPNPFAVAAALINLFTNCIPAFLALFPFFYLILFIIKLILLILTLICYLIERLSLTFCIIIDNIVILAISVARLDSDSITAIILKIGDLLCFLQNLFVILAFIAAIVAIIESILQLVFQVPPCGSSSGCCTANVCPAFLGNNNNITGKTGAFQYFWEVGIDSGLTLPPGFPPIVSVIRQESWQFYDPNLTTTQAFINIVDQYDLPDGYTNTVYFPTGAAYTDTTSPSTAPYTITFTTFYDPAAYGKTDPKGPRNIIVNNAIVQNPPTAGISNYDNTFVAPLNGTLNLIGGGVAEADGTPITGSNNLPLTIDQFFHAPTNFQGASPQPTDGVLTTGLTYNFAINHLILCAASLISFGCMPEVASKKNFINTTIGTQFNANGVNLQNVALPDVNGAQACIAESVNTLLQSISVETATACQNSITGCLNNLQDGCNTALAGIVAAGYDQYKSTFILEPQIQFTTNAIIIAVSINESSGQNLTAGFPASSAATIASQLSAIVTFGTVSNFTYDGYSLFTADLTSGIEGNGVASVSFNNNLITTFVNTPAEQSVTVTQFPYTFVDATGSIGKPIRDVGDVAREGQGGVDYGSN
jgi:hypothetical protein